MIKHQAITNKQGMEAKTWASGFAIYKTVAKDTTNTNQNDQNINQAKTMTLQGLSLLQSNSREQEPETRLDKRPPSYTRGWPN